MVCMYKETHEGQSLVSKDFCHKMLTLFSCNKYVEIEKLYAGDAYWRVLQWLF